MGITPREYSKEKFICFLQENNISDFVIDKFRELPGKVKRGNKEFDLFIVSTWYDTDITYYNFEINYYSEELVEFLFSSKIFTNVEKSINFLLCELMNKGYIKKPKILE